MSVGSLLKALRVKTKLSRPAIVRLLNKQGIRTSVSTLERVETGKNKSVNLVLALLRIYDGGADKYPSALEVAFLLSSPGVYINDTKRRFIVSNIHKCHEKELENIIKIIKSLE